MPGIRRKDIATSLDDFLPAVGRGGDLAPEPDAPASVIAWAERYRRIDGRPFSLARFGPLRALYEDEHPHICVIKPAQRGVSEWAINRVCFALDLGARAWNTGKDGLNVAYLFPTQSALSDFSKERITGLKEESIHLREMFKGSEGFDGVRFKQIGNSYLYLRGAWSESALLSFAADVLVLDEYDRMDPKARALARRRLNASTVRHQLDISTPTLPGRGIDGLYKQSDGLQYHQPCPRCGALVVYDFHRDVRVDGQEWDTWQALAPEEIRVATVALTCPACKAEVSDVERCAEGEWVAQRPRVGNLRGYQIPPLAFPMADIGALALSAVSDDPTEQTQFWQSDLGVAYDASGTRVTPAMLDALWRELPGGNLPEGQRWRDTTMGVDVGSRFHFRVSSTGNDGIRHVREMGSVRSWDDLSKLMLRYQVRMCVIDALPELHACREWADKYPARVFRAFYPNSDLGGQVCRADTEKRTIQIARTMAMDGVYDAIASGQERWPRQFARAPEVVAHLGAPVRVVSLDDRGQERPTWEHTLPDHLFHCSVYDEIALVALRDYRLGNPAPVFAQGTAKRRLGR